MLQRLIGFSLRHSLLVLATAAAILVFAAVRVRDMPVDVFPELNAPTVVIMSEAGGLAPDEVETMVTFPVETAVNGLPGLRRVRSASATGLSIVWAEFDWGEDLYRARQLVSERLASVRESLPKDVHAEITPITSITGEVMLMALSSPDGRVPPLELRSIAEFELRTALLAVPGVAQVAVMGGELPEYQVNVRQERLRRHGLRIADVVEAARGAHSTATAGYLPDVERLEIPIRQTARVRGVDDIRSTLVATREGAAITIGDVADVALAAAPSRGAAADRGMPAVVLSVQKAPGTNTLELTRAIDAALDRIEPSLPPGAALNRDAFRAAHFIERSVHNVFAVLRDATVIVAVILILFLLNVRATLITLTAIPLSLAIALLALWAFGMTLNVMTLGGLAVAIGALVDDAIIDVENVLRRLRENASLAVGERRSVVEIVFAASNEIRPSIVFATVIICMVFVPLLFLGGLEGRFFRPLGIAYITSTMASLAVAITVTPALCKHLFAGGRAVAGRHDSDGFVLRWLKRAYAPLLRIALRRRLAVLTSAAVATLAALWLGWTFGTAFLPAFNEGTFTVFLMAPPGTSLAESDRLARGVESRLLEIKGARGVTRRTGRAERDEHAEPVWNSEIELTVEPDASVADVRRAIDDVLEDVPGVTTMIGQPIEHRLSHVLSGTPAAIAINVYGDDLAVLRGAAKEIEAALRATPGARDVSANREVMVTSLPIRYRARDLAAAGLTPAAAAEQVQQALYGETVAEVSEGIRRHDLTVRLAADERARLEQIGEILLVGGDGTVVRLRDVADIAPERTSSLIARESARRKAVVSCNVASGFNLGDLVRDVRARVDPIVARAGLAVHYGGQFEAQQSAARTITLMGFGVALAMFLILQLSTGSARTALLVMLNLPLALIGGVVAVFVSESPSVVANSLALVGIGRYVAPVLSIASLVGFVTLFGIAVRNGLLLVNHYDHIHRREGRPLTEAVLRGSMERLAPILMTALTAALGLVPLVWAAGEPGSELLAPLAIVVLGGLASSTLLNLFVVPAAYALAFRVQTPADHVSPRRSAPVDASPALPNSEVTS